MDFELVAEIGYSFTNHREWSGMIIRLKECAAILWIMYEIYVSGYKIHAVIE